jgi:dihydropyrimidinase
MEEEKVILIKGGTVVTNETVSKKDILIRGEKIYALGQLRDYKADIIVNARGLMVFPGGIDTHVHFNDDFMDTISVHNFYTGTKAAAYGGITTVIDFSNQQPGESLPNTIKRKREEAEGKAIIDWGIHPVITQPTLKTLDEIPKVVEEGAPTIKCYMTYRDEGLMVGDRDLKRILERLRESNGMLLVHAEDNDIIETNVAAALQAGNFSPIYHAKSKPIEAENNAIFRCINIARETQGRIFIVHMASGRGVDLINSAQQEGLKVMAETCTHYLFFTDHMLEREDGIKWICSPPLRDRDNQEALWRGIFSGVISMVTSDDAAFSWDAKLMGKDRFDKCPNGIPGVEVRLNLLYSEAVAKGKLSLPKLVDLISTKPAKLFGLAPQKGSIQAGSDADLVLFDPKPEWIMNQQSLHMGADWSAYENIKIKGKIKKVFSRGELIINGEKLLAEKGRGRYLQRKLDTRI